MPRTIENVRMQRAICYSVLKELTQEQREDILIYLELVENQLLKANPKKLTKVVKQYFSELSDYQNSKDL